jgi:DNA-binding NtrC family response regulator
MPLPASALPLKTHPDRPAGNLPGAGRGVLVVDDDAMLRSLLQAVLQREGFRVWLAGDGADAVAVYQRHRAAIDVVLLDVRMAGMDGPQTFTALQAVNPAIACCFMSGYTADHSVDELRARGALHFFEKPFRMEEIGPVLGRVAAGVRPGA